MNKNFTKVIASIVLAIIVAVSSSNTAKAASYKEYKNIREIKVSGNADIYLVQGLVESVRINDEVSDAVVKFNGNTLAIENYSKKKATIYIYVTQLNNFEAVGAVNIFSVNKISSLDLNLTLKGGATAKVDVNTLNMTSKLFESAQLIVNGYSESFGTKATDTSIVNIAGLKVDNSNSNLDKKFITMNP